MSSLDVQLSSVGAEDTILKLPYPFHTELLVHKAESAPRGANADFPFYQLRERPGSSVKALPFKRDHDNIFFSEPVGLKSSELPADSDNSAWARARRSPRSVIAWNGPEAPSAAQSWLLLYVLFTVRPGVETIRLDLCGAQAGSLGAQLNDLLLAIGHPVRVQEQQAPAKRDEHAALALRSAFWQGAGSPFGPRPVWCPAESPSSLGGGNPLSSYPLTPLEPTLTVMPAGDPQDASRSLQSWHPVRPAKPALGAVIYSRWIPHLDETFSMVSLDWQDEEHLRLFHEWQNDPRVSQGWNETGTLEQHRQYLKNIHDDPHQFAILAKWDDAYFAYFEVYWAKEDRLGGYYHAGDFDRGRHSLVGDVRFRGPHRVTAWWSSLIHFLFLDDPRTMDVVGEPKNTNSTVVMYDLMHGFGIEHFVDLPHKRSACVRCPRHRFFQLCPLSESEKAVGGMRIGLVPKL